MPDWSDRKDGLLSCLDSLFKVTPPTALIIQEAPVFAAVQQFLANRGLKVPDDVSLICSDPDPNFAWCEPTIAHMTWLHALSFGESFVGRIRSVEVRRIWLKVLRTQSLSRVVQWGSRRIKKKHYAPGNFALTH